MNRKVVLVAFVLFSLCVVGLLRLQTVYASPYTDISVATAYDMITNGSYPDLVVLDVRRQDEYDSGHIYGAFWIPHTELDARIDELGGHENHEIIVYCKSGYRSQLASQTLDSHNFTKVYNMLGGITAWQSAGYPVYFATVCNIDTALKYDSIQLAIDAPQTLDGHTILVGTGTYYENVVVNKSISLIGENRDTTVIDGGTGIAVHVTADNIVISDFTIQNNRTATSLYNGIMLDHSSNSFVFDNNANNNSRDGIELYYCSNCSIFDNSANNNGLGGISLLVSPNCSVFDNSANNNNWDGIAIDQSPNCSVTGNNVNNNGGDGIELGYSSNCSISGNNVAYNEWGIRAWGSDNRIFHNNFIGNTVQAVVDTFVNAWDDGYPSGGNYWSDHVCTGNPSNGSEPYIIDANNTDHYPFQDPNGWVIPGDINGDGIVSINDVVIAALAFGSYPGHPNWNPQADLNNDGIISIIDLVIIGVNFGKRLPL